MQTDQVNQYTAVENKKVRQKKIISFYFVVFSDDKTIPNRQESRD